MKISFRVLMSAVIVLTLTLRWEHSVAAQTDQKSIVWKAHDRNRPAPAAVDPGEPGTQTSAGRAPADAIVLFDGKDLSKWTHKDGSPAKWKVTADYFEVVSKTKDIITKQPFGDMQLHLEFREPAPPVGEDQDRGNSGVIIMGLYEIQVLDSYQSKTYPDGQAGAVYGQSPPLVNVSRPPGQWQTYDILFHAPRFDDSGVIAPRARHGAAERYPGPRQRGNPRPHRNRRPLSSPRRQTPAPTPGPQSPGTLP
jgi:hypothetical protein